MTNENQGQDCATMNRRTFFSKSVGCVAGLTLLTFPGMIAEVLATKEDKSKEELFKELEEKVNKFMPKYLACSSTSFAVLNDHFKLKADHAIGPLMPFAGGIASSGETCGAVSGSLLAMGYFFQSQNTISSKNPLASIKCARMFCDRFVKALGSTRCKEVVKHQFGKYYDFNKPEDQKEFMAEAQKTGKCLDVVKTAVQIAAEIILENSSKK